MRTLKLVVAYEGTAYHGWQLQPNGVTVQRVIEEAVATVIGPHRVVAAGRTDAGVHALGQVVSLRTGTAIPAAELHRALNALLPADVAVLSVEPVPNEFDPRKDAVGKLYRYRLHDAPVRPVLERNHVWHVWNVDWEKVAAAAAPLVGTHDFSSFQDSQCTAKRPVRTIRRIDVVRQPPPSREVWIEVDGDGFLKHMVRNVVGSLVQVGRGAKPVGWIAEVLAVRDRTRAGPMAPAHGLTLVRVDYDDPTAQSGGSPRG